MPVSSLTSRRFAAPFTLGTIPDVSVSALDFLFNRSTAGVTTDPLLVFGLDRLHQLSLVFNHHSQIGNRLVREYGDRSPLGLVPTQATAILELVLVVLVLVAITFLIAVRVIDSVSDREPGAIEQSLPLDIVGDGGASDSEPVQPDFGFTALDTPQNALTDEDYVLQLLVANSGRIHQNEIVEESDWSKSKVSRLLSKMDTNGQIEKQSLGRENLILLPEDVPAHVRSSEND